MSTTMQHTEPSKQEIYVDAAGQVFLDGTLDPTAVTRAYPDMPNVAPSVWVNGFWEPDLYAPPFLFTILVHNPDEPFVLPLVPHGTYSGAVDWGDGTFDTIKSWEDRFHSYKAPGVYQISLSGTFSHIDYMDPDARSSVSLIRSIDQWGDLLCGSYKNAFRDANNLLSCPVAVAQSEENTNPINIVLKGATSLNSMFLGCKNLKTLDAKLIDTSLVTDICAMMWGAAFLTSLDLTTWDVSKITDGRDFLRGVKLDTTVYDATLIAWAAQTVRPGVTVHFGDSKYSSKARYARNLLTKNYTIIDGGQES